MRFLPKILIAASLLAFSFSAAAHEFTCTHGGMERTISVQHEVAGQEVPCVVRYDKPSEGKTEFPYSARHESGYCAEKAEYLATRLGTLGWSCERVDSEVDMEHKTDESETHH